MNNNKEIWKVYKDTRTNNIKNTRGVLWEISDQGRIKKNGVLYECRLNKQGYKIFCGEYVHRAAAILFILNPNNYNEVDHINGNKLDNRVCNLRWVTHKENMNNPITRKCNSESKKGKPRLEETRKKIGETMKRYWQNKKLNIFM